MARPSVNFTVASNGLGNVAPSPANTIAVLGCSSGGSAGVVKGPYYTTSTLITDVGYGNAPELAANLVQSGVPVLFVKVATDVAGTASAVTHSGTGTAVLTISGAPFDFYSVILLVTRAGTAGSSPAPAFKFSFDGGLTYSNEYLCPTNHVISAFAGTTGITFNLTAASMVVGDKYTFTTEGPVWDAADVATAIDALRLSSEEFGLGYVVGDAAKADADVMVASINQFIGADKFERFILEARDIDTGTSETEATWMAAIEADYASFQNDNVVVAAGGFDSVSVISKGHFRRNVGQLAIVRAALTRVGTDLAKVADGPLVPTKSGANVSVVYHDERLLYGLDANRFLTVTSIGGKVGYYITNPNIMCGPESDFTLLQYGRVIDEACRIANGYFTELLSSDVRLGANGYILEKDALAIESGSNAVLNDGLVATSDASSVNTVLSRSDKINNTKTLMVTIAVQPRGYIKTINIKMTFSATGISA